MGWTREVASAEGCSSRSPCALRGRPRGTGEPQGDRGAGNKACPPQSHIVTALLQPCSPSHAVFLADHSQHPPYSWGLLRVPCVYSGASMAHGVPLSATSAAAWGQSQPSSWRRWDCIESVAVQGGGAAPAVG